MPRYEHDGLSVITAQGLSTRCELSGSHTQLLEERAIAQRHVAPLDDTSTPLPVIPAPEVTWLFVGAVETLGGAMLLLGLLKRLTAVPLIIDMLVALASTKIPVLIGHGYLMQTAVFGHSELN